MTLFIKCWFTCLSLSIACEFLEGTDNVIYFYVLAKNWHVFIPQKSLFLDEWINHDMLWPIAFLCVYHCLLFKSIKRVFSRYLWEQTCTCIYTHTHKSTLLTISSYHWVDINQLANIIHKYTVHTQVKTDWRFIKEPMSKSKKLEMGGKGFPKVSSNLIFKLQES